MICQRTKFSELDIKSFLENENLFKNGTLDFETFKKAFFPQLFHVNEEEGSDEEQENIMKFKSNKKQDNE